MWVGWKAQSQEEPTIIHKVWYLPQINQSPTLHAVVAETMNRAQKMAMECGKDSITVTYDLAIAKIALQIQATEAPKYDNLFFNLGAFHIELAFFNVLGKYFCESGGPYILSESDVLASGSMKGFLNGRSYNRNKRIHELFVCAMEIMHVNLFFDKDPDEHMKEIIITELSNIDQTQKIRTSELSKELLNVLSHYDSFKKDTEDGKHGLTAQYWIGYIQMVHLYHEFSRSIREGDLELYIYCLPQISKYFFAFNHVNYSRWLVRFHDNVLRLKISHPDIQDEFKRGCFTLKRTRKPFSGTPIDLALEQTINADADNQRTGVSAITNSISARQKWAESHFLRISMVSHLFGGSRNEC